MKRKHIYEVRDSAMKELDDIDIFTNDLSRRTIAQSKINRAYKLLDNFKNELIRENIKIQFENQKKKW